MCLVGVLQPCNTSAFQTQCLPSAFQQAKDLTQHDLSSTTLQAPLDPFPTTKQSHPQPPLPPKKKISNNRKHTKCSAKVCCVLSPLACEPGDDLTKPTICDEKTDGLLQPPTNSRLDVGLKKHGIL